MTLPLPPPDHRLALSHLLRIALRETAHISESIDPTDPELEPLRTLTAPLESMIITIEQWEDAYFSRKQQVA